MKKVNQLIHSTDSIDKLKSILKDGLHTSYAKEVFCGENILIPMISFSNILFRDIGSNEVVNYGNYGIVIDRELAHKKYELNPVHYVPEDSDIAKSIKYNFEQSILPQTLECVKEWYTKTKGCCGKFLDNVSIKPLSEEIKSLINSIDENTSIELLNSYKTIFENIFLNSRKQMLIIKPYIVKDKRGKEWIAYNEREWRKSFFECEFIKEITPKGEKAPEYTKWENTEKPHLKDDKHTLKFSIEDLTNIFVSREEEINDIKRFLSEVCDCEVEKGFISTLDKLQEIENSFKDELK